MSREYMWIIIHVIVRWFQNLEIFSLLYQDTSVSPVYILEMEGNND